MFFISYLLLQTNFLRVWVCVWGCVVACVVLPALIFHLRLFLTTVSVATDTYLCVHIFEISKVCLEFYRGFISFCHECIQTLCVKSQYCNHHHHHHRHRHQPPFNDEHQNSSNFHGHHQVVNANDRLLL